MGTATAAPLKGPTVGSAPSAYSLTVPKGSPVTSLLAQLAFRTKPLEQHPAEPAMSAAEEPLQRAISGISGRFRRSDDLGRTPWTASGIIENPLLVSYLFGP